MDAVDRIILNTIQQAFPVDRQPYRLIGLAIGITEDEAWHRVKALRKKGIIRRIGGIFDSRSLGYVSTLCAAKVPEDRISALAQLMQGITEITHNYLRDHYQYNLWFTIIAVSQERLEQVLAEVKTVLGSDEVYSLPAIQVFKISVHFKLEDNGSSENKGRTMKKAAVAANHLSQEESSNYILTEEDKMIVRLLQEDLPDSRRPFSDLAAELRLEERQLIAGIQHLMRHHVMRRLGAILVHHKAGFTSNAMGVWIVPEEKAVEAGIGMAQFEEVSHCYQRPVLPGWPYNLFTMIHGHSDQECEQIMARISEATGVKDYALLFSNRELKKSSMRYFA